MLLCNCRTVHLISEEGWVKDVSVPLPKDSTLSYHRKAVTFWSLEASVQRTLDVVLALRIPVRPLVNGLWQVLRHNGAKIIVNVFSLLFEKLDVTVHPGILRLGGKKLNASD